MGSHAWPAGGRLGLARDRVMDSRVWVSRVRACPKWERPILTCPMPGPVPNPTEGGVATCQRKPGLMRGATLAWRSELGRSRGVPEGKIKVRRGWVWEGVSPSHTLGKKNQNMN